MVVNDFERQVDPIEGLEFAGGHLWSEIRTERELFLKEGEEQRGIAVLGSERERERIIVV